MTNKSITRLRDSERPLRIGAAFFVGVMTVRQS